MHGCFVYANVIPSFIACEISQIAKGGTKDGILGLLSLNEEKIGAMKFADDKYNSDAILNNRANAIVHGTSSSMMIIHNETESGLAVRMICIYADAKERTMDQKYGPPGSRTNTQLFANKAESDRVEERLAAMYFNVWRNHHIWYVNQEKRSINGLEYWYDKSRLHDDLLLWELKVQAETGKKPDRKDYVLPTHLRDLNTGTQFRMCLSRLCQ